MKDYKALEPVTVNADLIRLTDKQAEKRAHLLRKGPKKGLYVPLANLSFKAGEVIGLQDISKTHMPKFEEVKVAK